MAFAAGTSGLILLSFSRMDLNKLNYLGGKRLGAAPKADACQLASRQCCSSILSAHVAWPGRKGKGWEMMARDEKGRRERRGKVRTGKKRKGF